MRCFKIPSVFGFNERNFSSKIHGVAVSFQVTMDSVPGHLKGKCLGHTDPDVTLDTWIQCLSAYLQPLNDPAGVS